MLHKNYSYFIIISLYIRLFCDAVKFSLLISTGNGFDAIFEPVCNIRIMRKIRLNTNNINWNRNEPALKPMALLSLCCASVHCAYWKQWVIFKQPYILWHMPQVPCETPHAQIFRNIAGSYSLSASNQSFRIISEHRRNLFDIISLHCKGSNGNKFSIWIQMYEVTWHSQ